MRSLIAALLLCPTAVLADNFGAAFYDGNLMYGRCQQQPSSANMYAAGILDGSAVIEHFEMGRSSICTATNVTIGQAGAVMCRYLENHPEKRHLTASYLAMNAFREAWPCPR